MDEYIKREAAVQGLQASARAEPERYIRILPQNGHRVLAIREGYKDILLQRRRENGRRCRQRG